MRPQLARTQPLAFMIRFDLNGHGLGQRPYVWRKGQTACLLPGRAASSLMAWLWNIVFLHGRMDQRLREPRTRNVRTTDVGQHKWVVLFDELRVHIPRSQ